MAGFNAAHIGALDAVSRQRQRQELLGLSAYDRHKRFVHDLQTYYGGTLPTQDAANSQKPADHATLPTFKSDEESLRSSYRFIRTCEDDEGDTWEVRLAKRYYSRLYREYAIADLSRYKEGRIGLRWRTQAEVIAGRGQFTCGARGCQERRGLASFEVPFGYEENGIKKQALVKVRACPEHAAGLNYRKRKNLDDGFPEHDRKRTERRKRALAEDRDEDVGIKNGMLADGYESEKVRDDEEANAPKDQAFEEYFSGMLD